MRTLDSSLDIKSGIYVASIQADGPLFNKELIVGDIILVLKNLKTLKSNNETRTYTPRRITNLKCTEEKKDEQE